MTDAIATAAEAEENAALPRLHEVHCDPAARSATLPEGLRQAQPAKSPARWAYERVALYIRNFEAGLEAGEEVALAFTGSETGVIRIEGMGYFDPDILSFYGRDPSGAKTQIVQHVSRISVLLRAVRRDTAAPSPERIGFRLVADIEAEAEAEAEAGKPVPAATPATPAASRG
ncbi:hypothetical protein [Pseudoroseicyclus sp. CXY001]|uniref:hypothetical protein n=1 Tax=Pseudoroseicyclus sp. CXY001 TaxID=3242492 RepID=UPI003570B4B1